MLPIIDAAIARGSMTAEEKKKLGDIMDVEIDQNDLEKGAYEESAEIIESFLAEAESATQTASDNIEALEKESDEEVQKIKDEVGTANEPQIPPTQQFEPTSQPAAEPVAAPASEVPQSFASPQPQVEEAPSPMSPMPQESVPQLHVNPEPLPQHAGVDIPPQPAE